MLETRILLVDDHQIIRLAVRSLLTIEGRKFNIDEADNGKEALAMINPGQYDLVITDVSMPVMNGIELTQRIMQIDPKIKVLALTMLHDGLHIRQMLKAGVKGYLIKDSGLDELQNAIVVVLNGGIYYSPKAHQVVMESLIPGPKKKSSASLSKRENEILYLLFQEFSNREIAEKLFISSRTVETHKRNIMEKTGARNLAGLVKYAMRNGLHIELFI